MRISGAAAWVLSAMLMAGCSTAGHNFDETGLGRLAPGRTTMAEAQQLLTALPARVYPQSDGTTVALWSFKASVVNDGLYGRKSALLQFGPDGRFMRLLDSENILLEPWQRQKLLGTSAGPAR